MKELNRREKLFCKAYAKTENGEQSAKAAGYTPNSARQAAYRMLQKDYIKDYICNIKRPIEQKIQQEFAYSAIECYKNLCKAQELALKKQKYYAYTGETKNEPDLTNFLKAEELKAKLAGLFNEDNKPQQPIAITIKTSQELKDNKQ